MEFIQKAANELLKLQKAIRASCHLIETTAIDSWSNNSIITFRILWWQVRWCHHGHAMLYIKVLSGIKLRWRSNRNQPVCGQHCLRWSESDKMHDAKTRWVTEFPNLHWCLFCVSFGSPVLGKLREIWIRQLKIYEINIKLKALA